MSTGPLDNVLRRKLKTHRTSLREKFMSKRRSKDWKLCKAVLKGVKERGGRKIWKNKLTETLGEFE